jgi:hypothetical protein
MAGLTGLEPATSCVTGSHEVLADTADEVSKKNQSPAQFQRPLPVRVLRSKQAKAFFYTRRSGNFGDGQNPILTIEFDTYMTHEKPLRFMQEVTNFIVFSPPVCLVEGRFVICVSNSLMRI